MLASLCSDEITCQHWRKQLSNPRADSQVYFSAAVLSMLQQVATQGQLLLNGGEAIETIHQIRSALRRLRTVLREWASLNAHVDANWEVHLGTTFRLLGEHRDDTILPAVVGPLLEAVGAPCLTWTARPHPNPAMAVQARPFQATLTHIRNCALEPDQTRHLPAAELHGLLADRVDKLLRQVLMDGRHFERLATDAQHRVRKKLKRLHLLAELAQPVCPGKWLPSKHKMTLIRRAQEALGHHNDIAVASNKFMEESGQNPDALFSAGYLKGYLVTTAHLAQQSIRSLE